MIKLDKERMDGYGEYIVDGNLSVNYLYGLNDLCQKYITKKCTVLELGVNNGVSTELFCNYAKNVVCVDAHKTAKFEKVLEQYSNLKFYQTQFSDFYHNNIEKFDFIYIDGSHQYDDVKYDIENCLKLVKIGGIIAGHDYNSTCSGVIQAVNEHFEDVEIFSDSSWCKIIKQ